MLLRISGGRQSSGELLAFAMVLWRVSILPFALFYVSGTAYMFSRLFGAFMLTSPLVRV